MMAPVQIQRPTEPHMSTAKLIPQSPNARTSSRPLSRIDLDTSTSVSQNGCFESDRVLKSGYVLRRTRKTKAWKSIYLVLRPSRLSIYKTDSEDKLRHQIYLSDLTAVAFLKDPKHKRQNMFGLFSPSRNYHLEAPTPEEARSWVDLIRREARIEEEEEEMFLAGPQTHHRDARTSPMAVPGRHPPMTERDMALSSSPEHGGHFSLKARFTGPASARRPPSSHQLESPGLSGNELMSHSDLSDGEIGLHRPIPAAGTSFESLASPSPTMTAQIPGSPTLVSLTGSRSPQRGGVTAGGINRSLSQVSAANVENDPDRIVWHGWLYVLRPPGGVRKWKHLWGVLRPRNLILYKDESEYTAQHIIRLSAIVNVVDIDPISKSKPHCLQIITEEKSYRMATHDEESLVQCIGAFKSLLAKRRELEARAAAQEQQQQQQQQQR